MQDHSEISSLEKRIADDLIHILESNKDQIIHEVETFVMREAVRVAWPHIIKIMPKIASWATRNLLEKFGEMKLSDVANKLIK